MNENIKQLAIRAERALEKYQQMEAHAKALGTRSGQLGVEVPKRFWRGLTPYLVHCEDRLGLHLSNSECRILEVLWDTSGSRHGPRHSANVRLECAYHDANIDALMPDADEQDKFYEASARMGF